MFERGAERVRAHLEARERRAWEDAHDHLRRRSPCEPAPRATLAIAFAVSSEILDPEAPPPGS